MYCQGEMKPGTATYHVDRRGYHVLLDHVPAWICSQCGEVYFEKEAVQVIQRLIGDMDARVRELVQTV
jgi:YgiT-type zinc finger domain-containing protein